jgi:hypothetical protein
MQATNESVGNHRPGERAMSNGGNDWQRNALHQQLTLERQVVLGHLLPQAQAAADWQDMVRAQRLVDSESLCGAPPGKPHVYSFLRDLVCRWRARFVHHRRVQILRETAAAIAISGPSRTDIPGPFV